MNRAAAITGFALLLVRRFRFSLRTLLLATVVLGLFLGWLGNLLIRVRRQRQIVTQITNTGGRVSYGYEQSEGTLVGNVWQGAPPPGPKIIRALLGDDIYAYVVLVQFSNDRLTDA